MTTAEPRGEGALYRLLAWLSPNFPTGAFSYSHGLETAAADGSVHDRASLEAWVTAIIAQGSGRIDADILRAAYRAAEGQDKGALADANRRAAAFRATAELALEAAQQGGAFLATCRAAWPEAALADGDGAAHSAAFGAAAARAGIALDDALIGYLQSFAANLVAAGLRIGIVGQSDGQRILAALEPVVRQAAAASLVRDPGDFGAATLAADLASMRHETQYTRLFRS